MSHNYNQNFNQNYNSFNDSHTNMKMNSYPHLQSNGFDINIIYNMIIATTISSCVGALTTNFHKIFDTIIYYFNVIYKFMFPKKESTVNIVATIRINEYGVNVNFSQEYRAILSIIMRKNVNL